MPVVRNPVEVLMMMLCEEKTDPSVECRLEEEEEKEEEEEEEEEVVGLAPADQLSTCEAAAVELRPSWSAHL